jgi:small conductance mechanosensitive channel
MELINIALALGTIIIGVIIMNLLSKYVNKIRKNKAFNYIIKDNSYNEAILWYTSYFIKLALYVIIALTAISFLGFAQEILTLVAVVITLSIIIVLAYSLRDLIPSAFAGAYLMKSKLISAGDTIKVKDYEGRIIELNLLTTTIKDVKGNLIIIPNKIITEEVLKKESLKKK